MMQPWSGIDGREWAHTGMKRSRSNARFHIHLARSPKRTCKSRPRKYPRRDSLNLKFDMLSAGTLTSQRCWAGWAGSRTSRKHQQVARHRGGGSQRGRRRCTTVKPWCAAADKSATGLIAIILQPFEIQLDRGDVRYSDKYPAAGLWRLLTSTNGVPHIR